jgi:hypothetical protein
LDAAADLAESDLWEAYDVHLLRKMAAKLRTATLRSESEVRAQLLDDVCGLIDMNFGSDFLRTNTTTVVLEMLREEVRALGDGEGGGNA